ncbi:MAG: sugar phosphate nucleotidyltransferase [Deltaproteobacteria bacterium]|nr:sugar phosphate nucleotidyltransferase [Deltaproteobacteria bacterium]
MKAVILAAAPSDKLKPFTETRAKSMIRVAGKPILEHITLSLKQAGIRDLLVVVGHHRESIESTMGHGHAYDVSIDYMVQETPLGIGSALMACRQELMGEPFMLVYGDVLATGHPFQRVLEHHAETGGGVAAVALPRSSKNFGNVYMDPEMKITKLVEKPEDSHLANYVFAGIFVLPPEVFQLLEQNNQDMEQCFQKLIENRALHATLWDGDWIDITRPWHILDANRMLMDLWPQMEIHHSVKMEGSVHLEGPVHIEENVVIGAGSVLKGPCYIGAGSYIGNNTLIREYTALGPDSSVGYGTELKNCVLFGKSTLGRLSYIGDSVIGEKVHLGTGCCTVNFYPDGTPIRMEGESGLLDTGVEKLGAMIGDNVIIGARHVLEPGTRIRSNHKVADMVTIRTEL